MTVDGAAPGSTASAPGLAKVGTGGRDDDGLAQVALLVRGSGLPEVGCKSMSGADQDEDPTHRLCFFSLTPATTWVLVQVKASFQRSNSHDKVRKIVAEEGRAARNLIAWSVPVENKEEEAKSKNNSIGISRVQRINSGQRRNKKQNAGVESKGPAGALLDKVAEKSPIKARQPRKVDLRARYWAFLFDNLRRAVDEIYVTCESDQSVVECKEVLMMLNNYVRDFKALIDWIQLQEKLEKTDAQNRPTSLAWEVRKMSPGRHVMPSSSADRMVPSAGVRRNLKLWMNDAVGNLCSDAFTATHKSLDHSGKGCGPPPSMAAARFSHTGLSWADRVKCVPNSGQMNSSQVEKPGKKDAEGWETVQRGRTTRPRSAAMVAKVSPVLANVPPKQDSDKEDQPHLPPQQEQKLQPDCPLEKDSTNTDIEQLDPVDPDPQGSVGGPENGHTMEPPAGSVQDLGQCVDAPCEDAPPPIAAHTPSHAPEPALSSATVPPTDLTLSVPVPVPSLARCSSPDPPQTDRLDALLVLQDSAAEEGASRGMATSAPGQAETPMAAVKLESVLDPTELSTPQSMAEVLAKKEELADRLEKANEEAIASAIAEEEQLTREILAENNDLDTDNESDFSASIGNGGCGVNIDWTDVLADYDAREPWRQGTSWGEIVEEEPARPPGHGIHMHEKLSSPSRKRTIAESKKKHEEKQLKAQQLRDKLREEKTLKLQKLLEREREVMKWKEELLEQRRKMMDEKLLHADLKRELQLQAIVKKAQEEEAKVNEIAFINTLEAQNKRHDALAKLNEYEQRLNELQEDRQRRQEEKQARDEAVQERKRVLEADRQARVEELMMRRKEQQARIEQQRQEKEKAREDAARERARFVALQYGSEYM
ncbi:unnamed protein product [Pleuronectes platessa]|uniref:S phase cyclin A-associated protein in the endoplasmic reticulum N-terminal domain-containing protein n=1 Tax=Pleuronectes platessa TaxID=8262 RepID=A0A9N7ZD98_PLEPL|nr:unnamed protein product [Pleuronectes platessa]